MFREICSFWFFLTSNLTPWRQRFPKLKNVQKQKGYCEKKILNFWMKNEQNMKRNEDENDTNMTIFVIWLASVYVCRTL